MVPMIGPSIVPTPPMTTMKIMNAVQLTLKAASGCTRSRFR
jgi:hypothetical protein